MAPARSAQLSQLQGACRVTLDQIPLFSMLKAKLGYDARRQAVIAQNVANSETPGYAPKDLKAFSFAAAMQEGSAMGRTQAGHMSGRMRSSAAMTPQEAPDTEGKLDGNKVVLEEQMMKVNDTQGDFVTAIGFYQRALQLLHTASKKPGS